MTDEVEVVVATLVDQLSWAVFAPPCGRTEFCAAARCQARHGPQVCEANGEWKLCRLAFTLQSVKEAVVAAADQVNLAYPPDPRDDYEF